MAFTILGHRLTKILRPHHSAIERCPHSTAPFTKYIVSTIQQQKNYNAYSRAKSKTQSEETEQPSEPESDMAGILQLPDQEFFKNYDKYTKGFSG